MEDKFGDALKAFEAVETDRVLMPETPVIVRVDGRAFHTLTRGMKRPYDTDFMACMDVTAMALVDELRPLVGYVQSDEITLVFDKPMDFGSRVHKLTSVSAGLASSVFSGEFHETFPTKRGYPHFDSRVFQVPTLARALDVLMWREEDASRNSVSMLAQAHFSQKELHGKSCRDMKLMLEGKGVIWGNEPPRFKRGSYFRRVKYEKELTPEELKRIPEAKRPTPGTKVVRSEIRRIELEPLRSLPTAFALAELFLVPWSTTSL